MGIEGTDPESVKARYWHLRHFGLIFLAYVVVAGVIATQCTNVAKEKEKDQTCEKHGGVLIEKVCYKKELVLYIGK